MPSLNDNLSIIRLLLDKPDPQNPSPDLLFTLLTHQVQHHLNQLQNSSAHWSVAQWSLITSTGNEDYLIAASNFGKPFFVESADLTDISFVRREVPFVLLQNKDQFYRGVQQTQISEAHTAQLISFYRSFEGWYARITPIPGGSKEYRVWYETAAIPEPALGSQIGLSPFQHLICVQTALAALPHCHWGQVRPDAESQRHGVAWERKTKAIAAARLKEEAQFQREFSTYIGTLMQAGIESRDAFGDDCDTLWWANTVSW